MVLLDSVEVKSMIYRLEKECSVPEGTGLRWLMEEIEKLEDAKFGIFDKESIKQ